MLGAMKYRGNICAAVMLLAWRSVLIYIFYTGLLQEVYVNFVTLAREQHSNSYKIHKCVCWTEISCVVLADFVCAPLQNWTTFLKFLAETITICVPHYTMHCKAWIDSIYSLLTKIRNFEVNVTVHRNKFLFNKTNQMQ